jgi:hypothetical protein
VLTTVLEVIVPYALPGSLKAYKAKRIVAHCLPTKVPRHFTPPEGENPTLQKQHGYLPCQLPAPPNDRAGWQPGESK